MSRPGWRRKIESCQAIDIRQLRLDPGHCGSVPGAIAIGYLVIPNGLHLAYSYRSRSGWWESVDRVIEITHTDQHFGGHRSWLLCSECDKRAAILYLQEDRVACRTCLNLIYTSQAERYWERADRMATRIMSKLVDGGDYVYKPKRMHWRTFDRLYARYEELQEAASDGLMLQIAKLLKRARH